MATIPAQEEFLDRVREALTKAGIDLGTVLTTGIERVGADLVSVVVIDPATKEPKYRALLDLPPVRITPPADPPVGKAPSRVWVLVATDGNQTEILDVYSSPQGAEAGLKRHHEDYLNYIRGYSGENPSEQDEVWLEGVKQKTDLGYHGEMDIYEWRVED